MIRKSSILIILLLLALPCSAQLYETYPRDVASKKVIGKYNLSVMYKFSYRQDTISKGKMFDIEKLEVGDSFSRYFSRDADIVDSLMYKNRLFPVKNKVGADHYEYSMTRQPYEKERYSDIYMNYPVKGTLLSRVAIVNTEYEYCEPVNAFVWQYSDSVANVLGYNCKIAFTFFRGRNYKVYYTEEIPVSYGPWKFYGLPGLIMKVEEKSDTFIWETIGISQKDGDIYIFDPSVGRTTPSVPYMKIKKTTRAIVQKLEKLEWQDPLYLLELHGKHIQGYMTQNPHTKELKMGDIKDINPLGFMDPYVPPLELE